MITFITVCVIITVTALYLLQQKRLIWPLQQRAAKGVARMAFGLGLLVSIFRLGFWAGVFTLIVMLMAAAVLIPFVFIRFFSPREQH